MGFIMLTLLFPKSVHIIAAVPAVVGKGSEEIPLSCTLGCKNMPEDIHGHQYYPIDDKKQHSNGQRSPVFVCGQTCSARQSGHP